MERSSDLSSSLCSNNEQYTNFRPFAQPIVELETGKTKSYEILTRGAQPLDIKAYYQSISSKEGATLTLTILLQAMIKLKHSPIPLQFNLSARQLLEPGIVQLIKTIMQSNAYPRNYLLCELVEYDPGTRNELKDAMNFLRSIGLTFALDDFGTTYNGYDRLFDLPLNQVKIDRSMIDKIDTCGKQQALAKHFLEFFPLFNDIELVFEGIETQKQHDALLDLAIGSKGKVLTQGYLYAKPQCVTQMISQSNVHQLFDDTAVGYKYLVSPSTAR